MAVLNQIREYDPVSFVTAIGDVTLTLRFYRISARGNPRGLPFCDLKLTQTRTDRQGTETSYSDETAGISVRAWGRSFAEEELEAWERRMAAFEQIVNLPDDSVQMFRLNYAQTLLFPPLTAVVSSHDPTHYPERDKYLEREENYTGLYFGLLLGGYQFDPGRLPARPATPTLFGDKPPPDPFPWENNKPPIFCTRFGRDALANLRRLADELRQHILSLTHDDEPT